MTDRLPGGPMDRWPSTLPVTGNEILELMTMLGRRLDEMNTRLQHIEKQLEDLGKTLEK